MNKVLCYVMLCYVMTLKILRLWEILHTLDKAVIKLSTHELDKAVIKSAAEQNRHQTTYTYTLDIAVINLPTHTGQSHHQTGYTCAVQSR